MFRLIAGYTWDGMIHRTNPKQWAAMLDIHLTAPFRMIQVCPHLAPHFCTLGHTPHTPCSQPPLAAC